MKKNGPKPTTDDSTKNELIKTQGGNFENISSSFWQIWVSLSLSCVVIWAVLYFFGNLLLPILAGAIIGYLLRPIVNRMDNIFPYPTANAIVCVSIFFLALVFIFISIIPSFVNELLSLANNFSTYIQQVSDWLELPVDMTALSNLFKDTTGNLFNRDFITNLMFNSKSWAWLWDSGYQVLYVVYLVLITPMATFYILKDWKSLVNGLQKFVNVFAPVNYRMHVHRVLIIINNSLSSFAHGQFLVSVILAVYYILSLSLLGLDSAVFIGLFSSIMIYVPYFGAMFNVLLASVVAIGQFSPSFVPFILVLVIYAIGQILEDVILLPIFLGKRMSLHPLLVIIAVFAFAQLFGIVGILVSVPFVAVIRSVLVYIMSLYSSDTPAE